jgi:hypothetical protein
MNEGNFYFFFFIVIILDESLNSMLLIFEINSLPTM